MVFKTVEGLKDAVSAEEHTVKGKKVGDARLKRFFFYERLSEMSEFLSTTESEGGSEEGAGEAGQSVRGEVES